MTSEIRVNKLTNRIGLSTVTFADSGIGVTVTGRIDPDTDSARDLGTTSVRWRNAYVDTYYGDGSNLTGISAGTSLSGSTNNTVCTVTGANAIQGESNLTFDGTTLGLTGNQTVSGTVQVAGNSNFGAAAASPSPSALTVKMATNKHIGFSPTQSEVGNVPALVAFQDNGSLNSIGFRGTELRFAAGSAERLRITDGGNLMLRSTAVNYLVMGSSGDSGFGASISNNMNWIRGNQTNLQMNTATGGFMGFEIGGSEKLRITSNGVNLGGNYTQGGANPQLSLYGSSGRQFKIMNSGAQTTSIQLQNSTTGYGEDAGIHMALLSTGTGYLVNQYAGTYAWEIYQKQSGGSQKHIMRVYRDGKIGQQTDTDNLMLSNSQDGGGSNYFLRGSKNSTTPGGGNDVVWIYEDGDMRNNNNSYGQQSDIKLKENVVDANSQWDDIKKLKVRNFNFKASTGFDTHTQIGLIAQEAELVSPGLVKEVKDRVKTEEINEVDGTKSYKESLSETEKTKHVMYSVLYMKAIKALQEAMTRIETLEQDNIALRARITNLEGN